MQAQIGKTAKIRKQPRRTSRRQLRPYFKNPLKECNFFLPKDIKEKLISEDYICIRSIQDLIPIPLKSTDDALEQMKKGAAQQQRKVHQSTPKSINLRKPSQTIDPIWSDNVNQDPLKMFTDHDDWKHQELDVGLFLKNDN